jgi:hypothetical protein
VTLEPLPDDVPAVIRLRHALKRLLRCYRLKCVAAEELREDDWDADPVELRRELVRLRAALAAAGAR